MFRPILIALAITQLSTTTASAEVSIGGDLVVERDFGNVDGFSDFGDFQTQLRGEVAIGYQTNSFGVYGGFLFREDTDDIEIDWESDGFWALRFENITLSWADPNGAGSMVSEDYFGMDDTTGISGHAYRLDVTTQFGHFAISHEEDDGIEAGYSGKIGENFLRVGWEADDQDIQIVTGRDMGKWGYHLALQHDLDDSDESQIGATFLYDITNQIRVAGNVALGNGDETVHSWGAIAWIELPSVGNSAYAPTIKIEIENNFEEDDQSIEIGLHIPFGKPAPHHYERHTNKEEFSGFGYY